MSSKELIVTHVRIIDQGCAEENGWPVNEPIKRIDCAEMTPDNVHGLDVWVFSRKKMKAVKVYGHEYSPIIPKIVLA